MRYLPIIGLFIPFLLSGQVGGSSGYQMANVVTNARTAALAGTSISINDGDISQFFENPAILDSVKKGSIFFTINPYFANVSSYTGAYAFEMKKLGVVAIGLNYLNFGSFDATDATGNLTGTFNANDYVLSLGKAHRLGPVVLGINLKLAHSSIENFSSTSVIGDIGGTFDVSKNWTLGMVFSNIGGVVSNYNELTKETIPFDVKVGTSFKPEYMPLKFTITTLNLVNRNVVNESDGQGRSNNQVDKVMRRVNFGVELLLSKNFQVLFGYNHKRKQELKLDEIGGGAGFSYGLMLGIKQFSVRFSRATYHAAGGTSFISVQTNLNDFKKIL
ncbi:MAG: type IX secretion system protein PorQ [Bacteroidota bacterium]